MTSLSAVLAIADPNLKTTAFQQLVDDAASRGDIHTVKTIIDAVLDETMPFSVPQAVLSYIPKSLEERIEDNTTLEQLAEHALTQVRTRLSSFEEIDFLFRDLLYRIYVGEGDYLRAATVLSQAVFGANMPDQMKVTTYIRIAQNYIKGENDALADKYMRNASLLVDKLDNKELLIQVKACYAQMSDIRRKFIDAAVRYNEVLRMIRSDEGGDQNIKYNEEEVLEKSAKCAILAPAGTQRSRLMAMLAHDERFPYIAPIVHNMLEMTHTGRLVMPSAAAAFAQTLAVHQRAVGEGGLTVDQRAIIEHNIQAVSKMYKNIRIAALSSILGISEAGTESMTSKMIKDGRLHATIDQVDGFIDFSSPADSTTLSGATTSIDTLHAWDASIHKVCLGVNETYDAIIKAHPALEPV